MFVQNIINLSAAVHELPTLIANIPGTDQAIDKPKTAFWTTTFPKNGSSLLN